MNVSVSYSIYNAKLDNTLSLEKRFNLKIKMYSILNK